MILVENQIITHPLLIKKNITLALKREDLLHPLISGNKYRKLKYNLIKAKKTSSQTILTFGGAFSNHIAAVAYAGQLHKLKTIGVIRGEELKNSWQNNPTLQQAAKNGMQFKFISREAYKTKTTDEFIERLKTEFGNFYLVPEGGTNELAIKGCEEILAPHDEDFNYICCAVGTGGTITGLSNSAAINQKVLGFSALKGDFLKEDIRKFANCKNWKINTDYHFGGYAKYTPELITFINTFYKATNIPLDPIYTGKMLFGIFDLIQKNHFKPNTKLLAIHTGGLQGVEGINQKLEQKKLQQICVI